MLVKQRTYIQGEKHEIKMKISFKELINTCTLVVDFVFSLLIEISLIVSFTFFIYPFN